MDDKPTLFDKFRDFRKKSSFDANGDVSDWKDDIQVSNGRRYIIIEWHRAKRILERKRRVTVSRSRGGSLQIPTPEL